MSLLFIGVAFVWIPQASAQAPKLDNATCNTCHDGKKGKLEVPAADGAKRELYTVDVVKYAKSIHGDMQCIDCHKEITDAVAKHKIDAAAAKPNCITCHEALWETVKKDNLTE